MKCSQLGYLHVNVVEVLHKIVELLQILKYSSKILITLKSLLIFEYQNHLQNINL